MAHHAFADEATPAFVEPLEIGPVEISGSAALSEGYTDNVFSTENNKVGDFITILAPEVSVRSRFDDLSLVLSAEAELGFFASETSENYTDVKLSAEGEWSAADGFSLFAGIDHAWEHEPRSSPDDVGGEKPTEYQETSGFVGFTAEFERFTARTGINVRNLKFDDTPVAGAPPIDNDDRDRLEAELGARVTYNLEGDRQVFVQGVYDVRDYDTATDKSGFERDSAGFNAAIGYAVESGPLQAEVLIGALHQNYDDPGFDSVTAPDFGAEVTWQPEANSRVSVNVDRRLKETTLAGSPGYISDAFTLRGTQWIARNLVADGYLGYSRNGYQEINRTDHISGAGFGVRYYLIPNLYVRVGYGFEQRSSSEPGEDYDSHNVSLQLGADLNPAYRRNDNLAASTESGFYGGFQVADGLLKTSLEGPRGGGGLVVAEFGDLGVAGGVFAGYRAEIGDLVIGAELDGGLSGVSWEHNGGRTFSVKQRNSIGASALVGTQIRNGVLLYARAGVVGTSFETRYSRFSQQAVRKQREIGLTGGAGAEFPLSPSLSGRMEYRFTAYPDYDLGPTPSGDVDNFSSLSALASFGLVYHFGREEPATPVAVDFSGFYAGAQGGHGGLVSRNAGPRPTGVARNFDLDADRAGMGLTGGVMAGYGQTFGAFYLGAEIEGELANTKTDVKRAKPDGQLDPDVRLLSVSKKGTIGASIRAGYIVNDSVLIYGRAGAANTWFETDYAFGTSPKVNNRSSDIGIRVGAGVEFSFSDRMRIRLDYTRTNYGSNNVDYGVGRDTFDNKENMFRVGLTYAF